MIAIDQIDMTSRMPSTTRATQPMCRHTPINDQSNACGPSPPSARAKSIGVKVNQIWLSKIIMISKPSNSVAEFELSAAPAPPPPMDSWVMDMDYRQSDLLENDCENPPRAALKSSERATEDVCRLLYTPAGA